MKPNPVVHFELPADNRERMRAFYEKTFGWQTQQLGPEMGDYITVTTTETDENHMVKTPGTINGGFYQRDMAAPEAQHPSIVISVDNLEESIERVKANGGTIQGEPMPIPGVGKFAAFTDTEGNRLSILQPAEGM
ncbi:MAG: glyoxalase [Candidatus Campbellbacteria bacterium]